MRKGLLLLFLVAACGDDARTLMDPPSANLYPTTATLNLAGQLYEYGCPDFPCPVLPIVKQHVDAGLFTVMPTAPGGVKVIYLFALRAPVNLRPISDDDDDDDDDDPPIIQPPTPPTLTGPAAILGVGQPSINLVVCRNVGLTLNSPDGGPWNFASGHIQFQYVQFNTTLFDWVPTGLTQTNGINSTDWSRLLAGTFVLAPPRSNLQFRATINVVLSRGQHTATVSHTVLCHLAPPQPPPPPTLTGPTSFRANLDPSLMFLQCRQFPLALVSPDGGPWTFASGLIVLTYIRFQPAINDWLPSGEVDTFTLDSPGWSQLLGPNNEVTGTLVHREFDMTFRATLTRGIATSTVEHTTRCVT